MKHHKKSYVYFIQAGRGAIKIGNAKNLDHRLQNLQTANEKPLYLRLSIGPMTKKMAEALEADLHKFFKSKRIRGEWYKNTVMKKTNQWYWRFLAEGVDGEVQAHEATF